MNIVNLGPDLDHGHRVVLKGDGIVVNINCVDADAARAAAFNANKMFDGIDSIDIVGF
jgi:hypothetical protein